MSVFRKLPPIVPVVDSSDDLIARARLVQQTTREAVKELQTAIDNKQMAQKIVKLEEERNTLRNFLILFVQHFECTFSRDTFMNVKYAEEYIEAAKFLKETYGREGDIVSHVEIWIEEENQKI